MPLVFGVLAAIVLMSICTDKKKANATRAAAHDKFFGNTAAELERRFVDMYVKDGLPFDEAFRKGQRDIKIRGYLPCLRREDFQVSRDGKSICTETKIDIGRYDSWKKQGIFDKYGL